MEMELGTPVYDIDSMMTAYCSNNNKSLQALISSLFKLPNGSTHGDETWYACILHHFHDDNRHFSLLLIFIGGLPPFTEILYVQYIKMSGDK